MTTKRDMNQYLSNMAQEEQNSSSALNRRLFLTEKLEPISKLGVLGFGEARALKKAEFTGVSEHFRKAITKPKGKNTILR